MPPRDRIGEYVDMTELVRREKAAARARRGLPKLDPIPVSASDRNAMWRRLKQAEALVGDRFTQGGGKQGVPREVNLDAMRKAAPNLVELGDRLKHERSERADAIDRRLDVCDEATRIVAGAQGDLRRKVESLESELEKFRAKANEWLMRGIVEPSGCEHCRCKPGGTIENDRETLPLKGETCRRAAAVETLD